MVTRIGRAPDNTLVLQDTVSSRYHARIVKRGAEYHIEDLGSLNGTLVNSRPVHHSKLEDGDVIVIGGTELTFNSSDDADENVTFFERHPSQELIVPHIIKVLEQRTVFATGATIRESEDREIEPRWLTRDSSASRRLLDGLLEMIRLLQANAVVSESIERMLSRCIGLFDAFRAAILTPETSGRYEPLLVIPAELHAVETSQPEIDWVVQTQSSIVSCRPASEDGDPERDDLAKKPETILAAPVIANSAVVGVLYLESHVEASTFDESHLELLGAIATLLSVTIDRLSTIRASTPTSVPDELDETLPISTRQPARSQFVPWDIASRVHAELDVGPIDRFRAAANVEEPVDSVVLVRDLQRLGLEIDHYLGIERIAEPTQRLELGPLLADLATEWARDPRLRATPLEVHVDENLSTNGDRARVEFVMRRIAQAIGRAANGSTRVELTSTAIQGLIQIEFEISPPEIGDALRAELNRGLGRLLGDEIVRAHGGRLSISASNDSSLCVRVTLRSDDKEAER
ncbi:MAG: FHA domain-containing protein [Myxococcales bacterium]|nr:FHA domain-containing protein [Myxococcales bacterium]